MTTKATCNAVVSAFKLKIDNRVLDWRNAARDMGTAYSNAYKEHHDTLKRQEKWDKLQSDLAFAVLGAVSAGGLSALCTWVKSARNIPANSLKEMFAEGLEDASQALTGNLVNFASNRATSVNVIGSIPEPLAFQNELLKAINNQKKEINNWFSSVFSWIASTPDSAFQTYNRAYMMKFMKNYLDTIEKRRPIPKSVNTTEMQKELELGIWAQWIPGALRQWVPPQTRVSCFGSVSTTPGHHTYKEPGKVVEKRFNALGITKDSGVKDFGWDTTTGEIKLLIKWGQNWKPAKTFG